jgi:putative N-acetylmannosamine-6-phosphate epimerase
MKIQVIDGLQAIKHVKKVTGIYKRNYDSLTIRITGD